MAMTFGACKKCGKDPVDHSGSAPGSVFNSFYCAPSCQPDLELSHELSALETAMLEMFVEGSHLWGDVMTLIRMAKTEERARCAFIVDKWLVQSEDRFKVLAAIEMEKPE